eukprot:TRINITY_DN2158_c0_g2_i12.p1 TRINITY_DN2158_c0_g2~~TRINITY_DN2158_c0_g2_i12.p1  ORF type:complete len:295 (-),score=33.48 TRINITY_DN2158_c0_g2_i12:143-976(-)
MSEIGETMRSVVIVLSFFSVLSFCNPRLYPLDLNQNFVLSAGQNLVLPSGTWFAKNIYVPLSATLTFSTEGPVTLNLERFEVNGTLNIGEPNARISEKVVLNFRNQGTIVIGGTVNLFGTKGVRDGNTKLLHTANAGTKVVRFFDSVTIGPFGWKAGDQILIDSGTEGELEIVEIGSIIDPSTVMLTEPLRWDHTVSGGTRVSLLSRDIVIRGSMTNISFRVLGRIHMDGVEIDSLRYLGGVLDEVLPRKGSFFWSFKLGCLALVDTNSFHLAEGGV